MTDDKDDSEEDFARMLEESLEPQSYEEGQMVEGRIVSLGADVAFVDVGGKGEATIDLEELVDPDGKLDIAIGDIVQAIVVSTAGGIRLSHRLARGAVTREKLAAAFRSGLPVEGRVDKANKGGYDVRIGGQRAFCPISQIDIGFTADPEVHVGRVYTFRVTAYQEDGKNIVLSRRVVLEEQQHEQAQQIRASLVPGAVLAGRVASVQPYGAFVDLGGGIQGLLHVSEMAWSRVTDPNTVVRPGDEITVKVLKLEDDSRKISLGLKQLQADPWSTAADTYAVGQVLAGRVTRLAEFGAFVELEPGIEGLAHASSFAPTGRRDAWRQVLQPGAAVAVEVLSFDPGGRRIGLAVVEEGSARAARATAVEIAPGARLKGKVERHEKFGVFVFLAPGKTGLIPLAETGIERADDLPKLLPVGAEVEVVVLEVEEGGRRIRLSRKAAVEADERSEAREYSERQGRAAGEGFGSLADKLRAAVHRRDEDGKPS